MLQTLLHNSGDLSQLNCPLVCGSMHSVQLKQISSWPSLEGRHLEISPFLSFTFVYKMFFLPLCQRFNRGGEMMTYESFI